MNGKRLYDLARKGIEVERPAREISLSRIALERFDGDAQKGTLLITCSKGTYVRTIVHDLGVRLGTFAAMDSLARTRSGAYPLEEAYPLEAVQPCGAAPADRFAVPGLSGGDAR